MNVKKRKFRPQNRAETARKMRKIKPPVLAFSIIFAFVMALGCTLAWYTTADVVKNYVYGRSFEGDFALLLKDVFTPPGTPPGAGDIIEKIVGAKNQGYEPGFVRLLVLPIMIAADGETLLPASIGTGASDTLQIVDLGDKWVYCAADGYYYYTKAVATEEAAQNLFTELRLNAGLGAEYEGANLDIEVYCEASGTGNYRSSWWGGDDGAAAAAPWDGIDAALQAEIGG